MNDERKFYPSEIKPGMVGIMPDELRLPEKWRGKPFRVVRHAETGELYEDVDCVLLLNNDLRNKVWVEFEDGERELMAFQPIMTEEEFSGFFNNRNLKDDLRFTEI